MWIFSKNKFKHEQPRGYASSVSLGFLLSACGGGGGYNNLVSNANGNITSSNYLESGDVRSILTSGDRIIDATSTGLAWNTSKSNIVNYSISTGAYGERWDNAEHALKAFKTAMSQLEYYTKLNTVYLGYFNSPKD